MLTAMVGIAIFASLVGRSELEKSKRLSKEYLRSSINRPGIADTETDWPKVEAEDKKRMKEEQEAKERKAEEEKKSNEKKQSEDGGKSKEESKGKSKEKSMDDNGSEDKKSSDKQ